MTVRRMCENQSALTKALAEFKQLIELKQKIVLLVFCGQGMAEFWLCNVILQMNCRAKCRLNAWQLCHLTGTWVTALVIPSSHLKVDNRWNLYVTSSSTNLT